MEHGYRHKAEPISTILVPKDGLEPVVAGLEKVLAYRSRSRRIWGRVDKGGRLRG